MRRDRAATPIKDPEPTECQERFLAFRGASVPLAGCWVLASSVQRGDIHRTSLRHAKGDKYTERCARLRQDRIGHSVHDTERRYFETRQ